MVRTNKMAKKWLLFLCSAVVFFAFGVNNAVSEDKDTANAVSSEDNELLKKVPQFLFAIPGLEAAALANDIHKLKEPMSVAVDESTGDIYVSDITNSISVYGESGNYLGSFGSRGNKPGQFNVPVSLFIDQTNKLLFVLDQRNYRVQVFQLGPELIGAGSSSLAAGSDTTNREVIGGAQPLKVVPLPQGTVPQLGESAVIRVRGVVIDIIRSSEVVSDSFGKIVVLDGGAHRILIYNADGEYLTQLGKAGPGEEQLYFPEGLSLAEVSYLDDKGRSKKRIQYYIADSMNRRAKVITEKGEFLLSMGEKTDKLGKKVDFSMPTGISVDAEGNIYVLDRMLGECFIFDKEGTFHLAFGQQNELRENLYSPSRVLVNDKTKRVYICDMGNSRVMVYQLASQK